MPQVTLAKPRPAARRAVVVATEPVRTGTAHAVPPGPGAKRAKLYEQLLALYGPGVAGSVPLKWTDEQVQQAVAGNLCSPTWRDSLRTHFRVKTGHDAPVSYSGAKLMAVLRGDINVGGAKGKAIARTAYEKAFKGPPPVSYTAKRLREAVATNRPGKPGTGVKLAGGALTALACREKLKAAKAAGKPVPAYSALKADELRALVAKLGL